MIALALALSLGAAPGDIQVWRPSPQAPRVVFAHDATAPDAALHVVFRAGAADDLLEEGLTRVAQYALVHGQDGAPFAALDAAMYGAGAELRVATSVRECSFTLTAPRASFDAIAARVARLLLAPKVSDAGAARARRLALTDALSVGSDDWLDAFVAASVLVTEGVEGGGDYNNPIWGDPQTIRELPTASVKRHIDEKLAPANAAVIVTGAFDQKRMKALLGAMKGGRERPLRRPDIVKYLPFERDARNVPREVHLQLQVVDVTDAKSAAVVHVLASYLHDRLFWKLRKSGHVYSPAVTTSFREWLDFILVGFTVTPARGPDDGPGDLRAVMMEEIDSLEHGTVHPASLQRAVAIAKSRLELLEQHPAAYARELEARARGVTTVGPEVRAAVAQVDEAALRDAATRFLPRSRAVSFVFGTTRRDNAVARPRDDADGDAP